MRGGPDGSRRRHPSLAFVVAALAALAGCGTAAAAGPPAPGRAVGTRIDLALPSSVRSLPFTSATGRRVTLDSLRGRVVVISDTMTQCQETCPLDTTDLVQTAQATARAGLASRTAFLSITVDPSRDRPPVLRAYQRLYAGHPTNWLALTGSKASIDALWSRLGVYRQRVPERAGPPPRNWYTHQPLTYDIAHSDELFFFDDDLHLRFVLDGPPHTDGRQIPTRLRRFLSRQGVRRLAHPGRGAWTVPQATSVVSWLTGHRIPG